MSYKTHWEAYIQKDALGEESLSNVIARVGAGARPARVGSDGAASREQNGRVTGKRHQNLVAYFSENKLLTRCFWLDVEYEHLPAKTKEGNVQELNRQNQLARLLAKCGEVRPGVGWRAI